MFLHAIYIYIFINLKVNSIINLGLNAVNPDYFIYHAITYVTSINVIKSSVNFHISFYGNLT